MANLYEINQELLNCTDLDTGEIIDTENFDQLQIELSDKLESIALWYKNLLSDSEAYKAEKNAFAEREKQAKNKADSLKKYLDSALNGAKFSTDKVNITYRKSSSLQYDGTTDVPEQYLNFSDPTIDKTAITNEIKAGKEIKGFVLQENNNIQVK